MRSIKDILADVEVITPQLITAFSKKQVDEFNEKSGRFTNLMQELLEHGDALEEYAAEIANLISPPAILLSDRSMVQKVARKLKL